MTSLPPNARARMRDLLERLATVRDGEAAGIPEEDCDRFAIAACTASGDEAHAGEADVLIALQSMSKPFIYGQALAVLGREKVLRHCNVEPTGEAFNSLSELEEDHLPYNPMINSGAITMSALLHHHNPDGVRDRMMAMFGDYLGREARIDESVLGRETEGIHRNKAIAHLLRHFGVIGDDIEGALTLYTWQCSVLATTRELARMAATLANGGVHPLTGKQALPREFVRDVLSVMLTCGMYDASGRWAYHVGLPAKSGISGGILVVAPGQMGLAAWSPRLDRHGNSVRAGEALRLLAREWKLGMFDA